MLYAWEKGDMRGARSGSIMNSFGNPNGHADDNLIILGIAVGALILLFIIANRYYSSQRSRRN